MVSSGRKALRPEEIPSPVATSHMVNSFGEKTLSQNCSLINHDVDDLRLVGPSPTGLGSPGQQSQVTMKLTSRLLVQNIVCNCIWTPGPVLLSWEAAPNVRL